MLIGTHHVYIEQAGYPLDAHLIFVNESGAVPYKFVRLQVWSLGLSDLVHLQ